MNSSKKIKAGALQYVLVISVIIAIVILAFISLVYLQQRVAIKHDFSKRAIGNTQLIFEYYQQKEFEYNQQSAIEFLNDENSTNTFLKKHWGVFDIGIATSNVKNEYFQKVALLGTQISNRNALFLKENNSSLLLVGNTKIIGNAALPKQGVKTGNIAGISYYGNRLIYGQKKNSTAQLPKIKNSAYLRDFIEKYDSENVANFELENDMQLHQSFTKETLVYEDNNPIILANLSLNGHLLIVSKRSITITASAKLKDVILIAPEITIESNTIGTFQAMASKRITVESNVQLAYPSALVVLHKGGSIINQSRNTNQPKEDSSIEIQKNTEFRGVVLYLSENIESNFDAQIKIAENSKVVGEVYCSKNTELQGNVAGSVVTNNFIIKKSGGTYVNHIYNGGINSLELPKQYAGLQMGQSSNQVAKWVD
ncbi:hypothetical protein [Polaribacter vadi]|uniref:hypothetical protein n=1 Tax=Polaribacter vadi TaxID=1774273 RepID=UPI0030EBB50E|tara:strand:- start:51799 stop:53076 length:1278 start_codon:yes stop_codon:yes gene_type:complete